MIMITFEMLDELFNEFLGAWMEAADVQESLEGDGDTHCQHAENWSSSFTEQRLYHICIPNS